ncbi:MAG: hypothetical protein CUN56_16620, partial [Phototrophicales bacterium]
MIIYRINTAGDIDPDPDSRRTDYAARDLKHIQKLVRPVVEFSDNQRDAILSILRDRLCIDDPTLGARIVDEIAMTGAVRSFGYASLLAAPHIRPDAVTKGVLQNWCK